MRIGLLAHDLADPVGRGLQRYTAGLARALACIPGVEVVLFSRTPPLKTYDDISARREVWYGTRELVWEQVELPLRLRRLKINVLHAPSNPGLPAFAPCPTVVTRHDEIERLFPPDFSGSSRSRFRAWWSEQVSLRTSSRVITVSDHSRLDILRVWGLPPEKVVNCGEGIEERFFHPVKAFEVERVRSLYGLTGSYVLYLGGFDKRKDVRTLLEAFFLLDQPGLTLALFGPLRGEGESIKKRVASHPLGSRVLITGRVPDEDLPALYTGCDLFVYPSRYEGFGLQVVEAMACGAPVVTSDGGSLPETGGGAAHVFPVGNATACASAIRDLLADGSAKALRRAGRQHALNFRWDCIVERYFKVYRDLAA
jgi:glycosyltransferase involved in cell wall biosynthesis